MQKTLSKQKTTIQLSWGVVAKDTAYWNRSVGAATLSSCDEEIKMLSKTVGISFLEPFSLYIKSGSYVEPLCG